MNSESLTGILNIITMFAPSQGNLPSNSMDLSVTRTSAYQQVQLSTNRSQTFRNDLYYESSIYNYTHKLVSKINELYVIVNSDEVNNLLFSNLTIAEALLDLNQEIINEFGFNASHLELICDYEVPDWKNIFVTIHHFEDPLLADGKLNELLHNWSVKQTREVRSLVTLSIL
ncbi:MAG: hypothetical protein JNL57_02355 [Bacteroidetes bacterium]|nr:hypothetical protein [Bacteroidota bacterium]